MQNSVTNDEEVYDSMLSKKEEVIRGKAINRNLIEIEYERLKMNYSTFKNSKELLAQAFIETIDFIKDYIR